MSSDDDKNKKGPKLFRPGAVPTESDKPEEKDQSKPKLFRPMEPQVPSPSGPSQSIPPSGFEPSSPDLNEPAPPPKPKLFSPSSMKSPEIPPLPSPPSGPKLFKPSTPTPSPIPEPTPPMAPPSPSGPKLFKPSTPTPSPIPEPTPPMASPMAPPSPSGPKLFTPTPVAEKSVLNEFELDTPSESPEIKKDQESVLDEFISESPAPPMAPSEPEIQKTKITPTEISQKSEPEKIQKDLEKENAKKKANEEKDLKKKIENTKKVIKDKENQAKASAAKSHKTKDYSEAIRILNDAKELAINIDWKEYITRLDDSIKKYEKISQHESKEASKKPESPEKTPTAVKTPSPEKKKISRDQLLALAAKDISSDGVKPETISDVTKQKGRGVIRKEIVNKINYAKSLIKAKEFSNAINELTEARNMAQKIKWLDSIKKINNLIEKTKVDYKSKGEITESGFIRAQLFEELDVRAYWYRAIGAGFLASISMVFISYLLSSFIDENMLARTAIFTPYSHGNIVNEFLALWAASFTPFSQIGQLAPDWKDDFILYLLPTIIASLLIALNTKHPLYAVIGTGFFAFFSVVLPFAFLMFFPALGIMDPSAIDASLLSAFALIIDNWGATTTAIALATNSVFFGYCISGLLEITIVMALVSVVLSFIFMILKKIFKSKW